MKNLNQRGAVDGLLLVALFLMLAFGAFAFTRISDADKTVSDGEANSGSEIVSDSSTTFQSTLYTDLSFEVPAGWTVNEPETYNLADSSLEIASSTIDVTNGSTTQTLTFLTQIATGFESLECLDKQQLKNIGNDMFRYASEDGVRYELGFEREPNNQEDIRQGPNFIEARANFCANPGPMGDYTSTVLIESMEDVSGLSDESLDSEFVKVWLMRVEATGDLSEANLADLDSIARSIFF